MYHLLPVLYIVHVIIYVLVDMILNYLSSVLFYNVRIVLVPAL